MDGARCHLHFDGKEATAYARSGKIFKLQGALNEGALLHMKEGETFDGELLFLNEDGTIMDRKSSNGIANKALKGTVSENEASRVIFVAWDIVDFTSKISYKDRFKTLYDRFFDALSLGLTCNFRLVRSIIVENQEEAYEFYKKQRADKQEGAILKNLNAKWEPKRTKDQGKMKAEEEADLKIVGWEYGTGKNSERMGNIVCSTADHKLIVNVGTGFSDEERDQEWPIGSIVTVRYNEVIKDRNSATYSLFLPRFIERRFDKKVANKFEELK
jgi:ATP-dependent DNA ligase